MATTLARRSCALSEIGAATIIVCGPACEAEARARILLRIHGSLSVAFRQALHDWHDGTGQAGVVLALLDREVARARPMDIRARLARMNRHRQHACEITAQALDAGPSAGRTAMLVL
jgi:hypothetical protein